jgi:hypothetical protein|tara:strand:+ start:946 stop:1257 length:312 start_codon:yes stop_codon:yes gene_type:complete
MIFTFLKKQSERKKKIELLTILINSIHIDDDQKNLYLQSLEVLDTDGIDNLYREITVFVENFEMKELEDIQKQSFSSIAGMKKKEAEERAQELNSFGFLLHNI